MSYINPSVLHNTMVNMADRVGEIRPATVLFISCRYVTPINGIRTLQRYTVVCQDVAQQVCACTIYVRTSLSTYARLGVNVLEPALLATTVLQRLASARTVCCCSFRKDSDHIRVCSRPCSSAASSTRSWSTRRYRKNCGYPLPPSAGARAMPDVRLLKLLISGFSSVFTCAC